MGRFYRVRARFKIEDTNIKGRNGSAMTRVYPNIPALTESAVLAEIKRHFPTNSHEQIVLLDFKED